MIADARRQGGGVNVERPTGRTTLTPVPAGADSVVEPLSWGSQRGDHQAHTKWAGRPEVRLPGISSRRQGRMVVFGHSHGGLTHFLDHAPSEGVMPLLELAPLL